MRPLSGKMQWHSPLGKQVKEGKGQEFSGQNGAILDGRVTRYCFDSRRSIGLCKKSLISIRAGFFAFGAHDLHAKPSGNSRIWYLVGFMAPCLPALAPLFPFLFGIFFDFLTMACSLFYVGRLSRGASCGGIYFDLADAFTGEFSPLSEPFEIPRQFPASQPFLGTAKTKTMLHQQSEVFTSGRGLPIIQGLIQGN